MAPAYPSAPATGHVVTLAQQTPQDAFNAAYWKSKNPLVVTASQHALKSLDMSVRYAMMRAVAELLLAQNKVGQGDLVDVPIMAWGCDPYLETQLRLSFGYAWVPSALTPPVEVAPGLVYPGLPTYDPKHAPQYAIQVAGATYPPYPPVKG